MLVSELRVGNFINHIDFERLGIPHKEVFHLNNAVNEAVINYCSSELYQPIPLTEEWLVRFGGKKTNGVNAHKFIELTFSFLEFHWDNDGLYLVVGETGIPLPNIEFVHQFQNLVHGLTSEELALKQTDNI